MCVKLSSGNLNPDPYTPHPISIYTYGVTTVSRVRKGVGELSLKYYAFSKRKGRKYYI